MLMFHSLTVCSSPANSSQQSAMDLSDALSDNQSGGPWPSNPTWPGQPAANPTWPGGQPAANPAWPGGQPAANPTWPGAQPAPNPMWPGGQPSTNPTWPGGQPAVNPTWPGGQSGGNGVWPGGNPSQPTTPGGFPSGPGAYGPGPGSGPTGPQRSLAVPYEQILPEGLYDKLLITINGTIKPNAEKITVNLSASSDIAFHFNPRFNDYGQKVLVRNTCIKTKWGQEERNVKEFPFTRGQPFQLKILCTKSGYMVAVNNVHLFEYKHRITNLKSINKLSILYDLTLSNVTTETAH
ncbi:galectin-3b [Fundulus heteroclitus]|uniref:galectin-3b n=1 Tax=Fundulus heteroclitus TaxID=8078 RepID=UPI00165C5D28|nr:galectin-3b [Fundulus heteroclitus]